MLIAGRTKRLHSFVSDSSPLDSTALSLSGLNPAALKDAGQGRNGRAPLTFIKKP